MQTAWLALGLALDYLGWLWVGHCCPPMHEQVEKTVPCALHGTYFQWGSFFLSLGKWLPAECPDYCKLVNGWAWFES